MARHQARSRAEAKRAVAEGRVTVDGVTARRSSTRVGSSSILAVDEAEVSYVSRGGHKLDHAIDEFAVEVAGRRCLDAGASTGGFTDCLLRRGAEQVVALDVGRANWHRNWHPTQGWWHSTGPTSATWTLLLSVDLSI